MKSNPFHFEIKDLLVQFVAAFDDVIIGRYNRKRELIDRIGVKYVYAPKQRVLHDLINKPQHISLPAIAVSIGGISRDNNRVFNKIAGSYYQRSDRLPDALISTDFLPQPVPVDIQINMSVITKYQTDMDQILTNFVPYTDPYIVVSWRVPDKNISVDQEIRSLIEWSGNIALDYPLDIASNQPFRVTADTSFTIKGWMFKKEEQNIPNVLTVSVNAEHVLDEPTNITNQGLIFKIGNETLSNNKLQEYIDLFDE